MANQRRAFTLIELLVVIAIIGLLLSIMTPALTLVKEKSRAVSCRSNLKQLGIALELYTIAFDHKSLVSAGGDDFWFFQIAPYLGEVKYKENPEDMLEGAMEVLFCPSTKKPVEETRGSWGTAENRWRYHIPEFGAEGSYGMNSWVGGWELQDYVNMGEIHDNQMNYSFRDTLPGKANIPVFADCVWVDGVPLDTQSSPKPPDDLKSGGSDPGMGRFCIDRHNMSINVYFSDGHADLVRLEGLWKLKWNRAFQPTEEQVPYKP